MTFRLWRCFLKTASQMHLGLLPNVDNRPQMLPQTCPRWCYHPLRISKTASRWRCHWNFWILLRMFWLNHSSTLRESRFSRILENFFPISLLDLDLGAFSFHFSLSISISRHFHFTFHSRKEWKHFKFHSFFSRKKSEICISCQWRTVWGWWTNLRLDSVASLALQHLVAGNTLALILHLREIGAP